MSVVVLFLYQEHWL